MSRVTRPVHVAPTIVFLDGLTGTGKTMLGPLVGSLARVEVLRIEHTYEYLCEMHHLGRMELDAATALLGMYADLACYDTMIARNTNFRFSDLSGVWSNPGALRYLRRLRMPDGNVVSKRIAEEKPILQVLTHQALCAMGAAFTAYSERVRVIEALRHPLFLLEHWLTYIDRHGEDPRDFTIWIEHDGRALPWFASGWEERYVGSPTFDRVIYTVDHMMRASDAFIAALPQAARAQVLEVPFEPFVFDPEPWMQKIADLLGTQTTPVTSKVMREQKVPRTLIAAGPAKDIYRRYGWKAPDAGQTERSEYEAKRELAVKNASPEALEVLDTLSAEYEQRWGRWF